MLLVVLGQSRCFGGDSLKDVIDERVHDCHCSRADSSVGMDLLEDLVDVRGVCLHTSFLSLLVITGFGLGNLGGSFGLGLLLHRLGLLGLFDLFSLLRLLGFGGFLFWWHVFGFVMEKLAANSSAYILDFLQSKMQSLGSK